MTDKLKRLLEIFKGWLKILKGWLKKLGCGLNKLKDESKKLVMRLMQLIKSHKKESAIIGAAALVVAVAIILACILFSCNSSKKEQGDTDFSWGAGLTENIPCFSENADSLEIGDSFVAAYYSNVTGEQVASYLTMLDEEYGIRFESDHYPRAAVLEDKVIAIHYNVTEMRFSVTVAAKETETTNAN